MSDYKNMIAGFEITGKASPYGRELPVVYLHKMGASGTGFLTPDEADALAEYLHDAAAAARQIPRVNLQDEREKNAAALKYERERADRADVAAASCQAMIMNAEEQVAEAQKDAANWEKAFNNAQAECSRLAIQAINASRELDTAHETIEDFRPVIAAARAWYEGSGGDGADITLGNAVAALIEIEKRQTKGGGE